MNSEDIIVSVENGIVTLTGSVGSLREYDVAEENAFEGGAVIVVNKINVRTD